MKKSILFLVLFTVIYSCSVNKNPEFVGLEKIKIIEANSKTLQFSVNAIFKNPNILGGTLKTDDLKVFINEKEIAEFVTDTFNVPKKANFTIPLTVKVNTKSIFGKKNLGGLLNSFISQKLKVHYKGVIDYKVLGYSSTYKVDETQDLKLKF